MINGDAQIGMLARVLDVAGMRHGVIAQNVANVNTPGYQRQEVEFAEAFARALSEGNLGTALKVEPRIIEAGGGIPRQDGNNVDIDLEMGQLQRNALQFQVYAQILAVRMGQMRSAISGR